MGDAGGGGYDDASLPTTDRYGEPSPDPEAESPWPPDASFLDTLGQTWRSIVFEPTTFFTNMPVAGPIGPAVLFATLLLYAGAGADLFWRMLLPAPAWLETFAGPGDTPLASFLLAGPVGLVVTALYAGAAHLGLIVLGARRERAGATLRVHLFASAAMLFQIVPVVGWLANLVSSVVILVVGLRTVHRTTTGRVVGALLLPVVGIVVIGVGLAILVAVVAVSLGIVSR